MTDHQEPPLDREDIDPAYGITQELGFPPALAKACVDPFDYVCRLRDGTTIRFREISEVSREWVTLVGDDEIDGLPYKCPRGVDVRVSEIIWVADAPDGS